MPSLAQLRVDILQSLLEAGIERNEAQREIDLIVEDATGWNTARQALAVEEPLSEGALARIETLVQGRCRRIPLQYLLGYAYFMGLRFKVAPGVLIPRADTETLVEVVLKEISRLSGTASVLDVGVGSGAVAVALARLAENVDVTALDISADALAIAAENATLNGLRRIKFEQVSWMEYAPAGRFDVIVSNPPYIPQALKETLAPEVVMHEPHEALFGLDSDGLGFYRSLSERAPEMVKPGGLLAVEVGIEQAQPVAKMFETQVWSAVELYRDLSGIERVVAARAPEGPWQPVLSC